MTSEPQDTEQWLTQLRQGDVGALVNVFEFYRPRLREMVCLRIGNQLAARFDPSDVLQETYIDAKQRIEDFLQNPKVSPYVWLRGLTRERLMKLQREHLGAQRRTVLTEMRMPDRSSLLLAKRLVPEASSPSMQYRRKELRDSIRRALDRLSEEDRDVILMRHFEGMPNAEVAEALNLSVSAATMRHGRALVRLKELLLDDLPQGKSI